MSTGFSATNTRVAGGTLNIAAPAAIAPSLPRSASAVSESSIPPGCGFPSPNSKLSPGPPTPAPLPETPRASFWGVPCSCAATSPASTWPPLRSGKTHAESDHCDKTVRPSPDARQPLVFFLSLNCECDFSCTQRRKSHGWVVDAPGLPLTAQRRRQSGNWHLPLAAGKEDVDEALHRGSDHNTFAQIGMMHALSGSKADGIFGI